MGVRLLRLLPIALLPACALQVVYHGENRAPVATTQVTAYEHAPARAHRIVGWLRAESEPLPRDLSDVLDSLRESAASHGCDALLWDPSHTLVQGLVSDDAATGIYEEQRGGRRYITGARAACLAWRSAPE
jgi:hypothetical protein